MFPSKEMEGGGQGKGKRDCKEEILPDVFEIKEESKLLSTSAER